MANTRQLATINNDEEALVPKRVKKKKPKKTIAKKSVQIIVQEMQQMRTRLNALKQRPGENDEMSGILNKHFTDTGLPFLDTRSLLNYSATSKQAYINAHEHPITLFSFFSAPARLHLDRAQTYSNQIDKTADLGIEITSGSSQRAFRISFSIGLLLITISIGLGALLSMKLINRSASQNNGNLTTADVLIVVGITAASFLLGGFLFFMMTNKAYPALTDYFNGIKENNKANLNLLNQFSELLEKNDFKALQDKLHEHYQDDDSSKIKAELKLFPPVEGTRNAVADEETPLLRK